MTAQAAVYLLCIVASAACVALMIRSYVRTRMRLLLWCAGCFAFLCINSMLVMVDIYWPPSGNLLPWRQASSLAAVAVLIHGFLWETE